MLEHKEIEDLLHSWDLKFRSLPQPDGVWELSFQMETSSFTILIDNGVANLSFIGIRLRYLAPHKNHKEVYERLLHINGQILVGKFTLDDDGVVWITAVVPRVEPLFRPKKLRDAMGAVLTAADHWYVELLTLATRG